MSCVARNHGADDAVRLPLGPTCMPSAPSVDAMKFMKGGVSYQDNYYGKLGDAQRGCGSAQQWWFHNAERFVEDWPCKYPQRPLSPALEALYFDLKDLMNKRERYKGCYDVQWNNKNNCIYKCCTTGKETDDEPADEQLKEQRECSKLMHDVLDAMEEYDCDKTFSLEEIWSELHYRHDHEDVTASQVRSAVLAGVYQKLIFEDDEQFSLAPPADDVRKTLDVIKAAIVSFKDKQGSSAQELLNFAREKMPGVNSESFGKAIRLGMQNMQLNRVNGKYMLAPRCSQSCLTPSESSKKRKATPTCSPDDENCAPQETKKVKARGVPMRPKKNASHDRAPLCAGGGAMPVVTVNARETQKKLQAENRVASKEKQTPDRSGHVPFRTDKVVTNSVGEGECVLEALRFAMGNSKLQRKSLGMQDVDGQLIMRDVVDSIQKNKDLPFQLRKKDLPNQPKWSELLALDAGIYVFRVILKDDNVHYMAIDTWRMLLFTGGAPVKDTIDSLDYVLYKDGRHRSAQEKVLARCFCITKEEQENPRLFVKWVKKHIDVRGTCVDGMYKVHVLANRARDTEYNTWQHYAE